MSAWNRHSFELNQLVRQATRELISLVAANPTMNRDVFEQIYFALIAKYGPGAAQSAVAALENSRKALGHWDLPTPLPAAVASDQQIAGTFAWAAATTRQESLAVMANKLAGPLGRLIRQTARETVWTATQTAGTRYARLPGPKACAFCLMLASRGAVYSKQTVTTTTGRNYSGPASILQRNPNADTGHMYALGGRPDGLRYHDNCSCTAIESHTDADLPQIIHDLQDEWYEATSPFSAGTSSQFLAWKNYIARTRTNGESALPKS